MKLVYVAGRYTAPTREGVERHIRAAEKLGIEVAKLGLMPVVPHSNTSHPDYEHVQPYQFWIEGTLELLRRCDAVVTVAGWELSNGAKGECAEALRIGLPVFHRIEDVAACLRLDTVPCGAPEQEAETVAGDVKSTEAAE